MRFCELSEVTNRNVAKYPLQPKSPNTPNSRRTSGPERIRAAGRCMGAGCIRRPPACHTLRESAPLKVTRACPTPDHTTRSQWNWGCTAFLFVSLLHSRMLGRLQWLQHWHRSVQSYSRCFHLTNMGRVSSLPRLLGSHPRYSYQLDCVAEFLFLATASVSAKNGSLIGMLWYFQYGQQVNIKCECMLRSSMMNMNSHYSSP